MNQLAATTLNAPSPMRWLRSAATMVALMLGLLAYSDDADARFGGMLGFDGIGGLAFQTIVEDGRLLFPETAEIPHQGGSLGGLFSRPGLVGGFAAGFLGAGVLGLLFGHGMIGELNGMISVLGLVFQLALLVMLARLIWKWWRVDRAVDRAQLSPRQLADAYGRPRHEVLPDIDSAGSAAELGEPENHALKHSDCTGP